MKQLTDKEILTILNKSAKSYSAFENKILLFIYKLSKTDNYQSYEIQFRAENFMHLCGIQSKNMSAKEFYISCLQKTISIDDCNPSNYRNNMLSKIEIINDMLDFKHAKIYKIAEKNTTTMYNDFEMATGNNIGLIGYDKHGIFPRPTTLLIGALSNYCTNENKIIFILEKTKIDQRYKNLIFEIKKGLFYNEYHSFENKLLDLIDVNAFHFNKT